MESHSILSTTLANFEQTAATLAPECPSAIKAITPEILNEPWARQWWLPRHEEKLARIKKGNVDLLMIGDSITHGWENAGKKVWDEHYALRNAVDQK